VRLVQKACGLATSAGLVFVNCIVRTVVVEACLVCSHSLAIFSAAQIN
jgi:hypothetical protein